jgi:hypothetical protein
MRTWLSKRSISVLLQTARCARVILAGIGLPYNPGKPLMLANRSLPTELLASSGDDEMPGVASSLAHDDPPEKPNCPRQGEMSPSLRGRDGRPLSFISEGIS